MKKKHRSLLEQIYAGNFFPTELIVPQDPEYDQIVRQSDAAIDAVIEKLGDGGRQQMDQLLLSLGDTQYMDLCATFAFGLRTGIQLIHELFISDEVLPINKMTS